MAKSEPKWTPKWAKMGISLKTAVFGKVLWPNRTQMDPKMGRNGVFFENWGFGGRFVAKSGPKWTPKWAKMGISLKIAVFGKVLWPNWTQMDPKMGKNGHFSENWGFGGDVLWPNPDPNLPKNGQKWEFL